MKTIIILPSVNDYYFFKQNEAGATHVFVFEKAEFDKIHTSDKIKKYGHNRYWPEEYKVQGFRLEFVKSGPTGDFYDIPKGVNPQELQI